MSPSSSSTHETHQLISSVAQPQPVFISRFPSNIAYSIPPSRQESLPEPPPPIVEKAPSESDGKWKWSFSGIVGELRRRHRMKPISDAPSVRQSIIAILKTSCKTFSSCRPLASPHLVRSRVERTTHLYTALCACSLPSSGELWALKSLCSGFSTFSILTIPWFSFVSLALGMYAASNPSLVSFLAIVPLAKACIISSPQKVLVANASCSSSPLQRMNCRCV